MDYPNINKLVTGDLGLREDDVFTEFTNSSFYSPDGLEATAPVFSQSDFPELPSPLGQVAATFRLFEVCSVARRVMSIVTHCAHAPRSSSLVLVPAHPRTRPRDHDRPAPCDDRLHA